MQSTWILLVVIMKTLHFGVAALRQKYQLHIPHITAAELASNSTLMSGHLPFVVTGAMKDWPAMENWKDLRYLSNKVSNEWVDYYKSNMYATTDKPFLFKMKDATEYFLGPSETGLPRYMQLRLGMEGWRELEKDLIPKGESSTNRYLPGAMWGEGDWIAQCMPRTEDIDNFYRVNQWNMLLIGEKNTGIFLHHDHLAASSWQAHVVGRKSWVICPYDQSRVLNGKGLDPWKPNYREFPEFAQATCGQVTVEPGELLYYPAYWWHTTKCLDTPTVGITGLMVGVEHARRDIPLKVHEQFLLDLEKKCKSPGEDISKKWPGAAPPISSSVCAALPACFELWDKHVKEIGELYTTENPYAAHTLKGRSFEAAGDIAHAILSFRAAARYDENTFDNWVNLCRVLNHANNPALGSEQNSRLIKLCAAQQESFRLRRGPLNFDKPKKKKEL